ncbi:MAG: AraC family transcriptional regulator [Eubacteriales bacterium]
MMKNKPTPYYHKPQMELEEFQIFYNKDDNLSHVLKNSHPYYELYFLISGDVTYHLKGVSYQLKPGDTVLISPHEEHEVFISAQTSNPYERYVLWLHPNYLQRLSTEEHNLSFPFENSNFSNSRLSVTPDMKIVLTSLLEHIFTESNSKEFGAGLLTNCLIVELFVHLARIKLFQRNYYDQHIALANRATPIVVEVLDYINQYICEVLLIEDIANHFFISRSHLCKVFKDSIGISLHKFIIKKKLFLAKQDLLSGVPIQDICETYHFGNYSSFYRAFKDEYGQSPRELKKQLHIFH